MGGRGDGWPWSALAIEPTADRDAIHEAYATRKAALDAQVMRVSAFAELSEAREKALFLAAEMRRAMERGEAPKPVSSPKPMQAIAPPPASPKANAEPKPEPEISISATAFVSSTIPSLPTRADVTPVISAPSPPNSDPPPQVESQTTLDPYPVTKNTRRASVPVNKDREPDAEPARSEASDPKRGLPTLKEEARDLAGFLQLKKRWPFFAIPVFFLIAMCSGDEDERRYSVVSNDPPFEVAPDTAIELTARSSAGTPRRCDAANDRRAVNSRKNAGQAGRGGLETLHTQRGPYCAKTKRTCHETLHQNAHRLACNRTVRAGPGKRRARFRAG